MEDNKLRDMEPDERQRAIESLLLDGSNHPWIGDEFFPTFRKMMEIAWYYWTIEWDPLESTCRHASLSIL